MIYKIFIDIIKRFPASVKEGRNLRRAIYKHYYRLFDLFDLDRFII